MALTKVDENSALWQIKNSNKATFPTMDEHLRSYREEVYHLALAIVRIAEINGKSKYTVEML